MAAVTGQTVITNALTILGIVETGGSPSASESNDALAELNAMWEEWGIDEGLIYQVQQLGALSLTNGVGSYTIGTGATFNQTRPSRIYQAFVGANTSRNEIAIVDASKYYSHNDLTASAATPDELYPDFGVNSSGYATLYVWPVPNGSNSLWLTVGVPFVAWTLVGTYQLPYGYQDAVQYALAWRLISRFGMIVPADTQQRIAAIGQRADQRLRTANSKNRLLTEEMVSTPNVEAPPQARA